MTIEAADWLPPDAFTSDRVEKVLSDPVSQWSSRWFARGSAAVAGSAACGAELPVLSRSGGHIEAHVGDLGKQTIVLAALGIDLPAHQPNADDCAVLDAVVAEAIDDLLQTLDEVLPGGGDCAPGRLIGAAVTLEGTELVRLLLPPAHLVARFKAGIGGMRRAGKAPRPRSEAMRPTALTAIGVLGRVEVALEEVHGLSVGDVLVLDRPVKDLVELHVSDTEQVLARGRLSRKDGHAAIQL